MNVQLLSLFQSKSQVLVEMRVPRQQVAALVGVSAAGWNCDLTLAGSHFTLEPGYSTATQQKRRQTLVPESSVLGIELLVLEAGGQTD